MIIDAHTHLYPPSVFENPAAWATQREEPYWLACVAPSHRPSLQGWATADRMIEDMDRAGVDQAVILGWYWETADSCRENALWQIDWIREHPTRFHAFAPFNARAGPSGIEMLRRAFDAGAKGIGELNPPVQSYGYDDSFLDQALELAASYRAAVSFHVTDPLSRSYPEKVDTPISSIIELAREHPNVPFILAHLGGMMGFDELSAMENVFVDTAAVPLLYDQSCYRDALESFGAKRVLWGTDYPLRIFPRRQKSPGFSDHLADIRQASLPESDLEQILGGNIHRLLNPRL